VINAPRGFVPPRPPTTTAPSPGTVIAVGHPNPLPNHPLGVDHEGGHTGRGFISPDDEGRHRGRPTVAAGTAAGSGSAAPATNSLTSRPAAVPSSVRDLRNNIDTPMNRAAIRQMEQQDTYRRSPREVYGPAVIGAARVDMERRTYGGAPAGTGQPRGTAGGSASVGGGAASAAPQRSAPPPMAPAPQMSSPRAGGPGMGGAHAGGDGGAHGS